MIRKLEEKHICTKCNYEFIWKGHCSNDVNKNRGIAFIKGVTSNLRNIEYVKGKYIAILNCPNCGSRDEVIIEDGGENDI